MGGSSSKEEKEAKKRSKAEKKQQREGKKSHRGSGEKDVVNDESELGWKWLSVFVDPCGSSFFFVTVFFHSRFFV